MNKFEKHIKKFAREIYYKDRIGYWVLLELGSFFACGFFLAKEEFLIGIMFLALGIYLALGTGEAIYLKGGRDYGIRQKEKTGRQSRARTRSSRTTTNSARG